MLDAIVRYIDRVFPFNHQNAGEWERHLRDMDIEPEKDGCTSYIPDDDGACWYCGKARLVHDARVRQIMGT